MTKPKHPKDYIRPGIAERLKFMQRAKVGERIEELKGDGYTYITIAAYLGISQAMLETCRGHYKRKQLYPKDYQRSEIAHVKAET